ncbi:MAG: T9SS type A sorting domain-containing protein, partial [bacterium]
NLRSDLTGTLVESDKPIAIFAGHQRTKVPVSINLMESRDFLCEQMLPVNTWGKNAFVIPYTTPLGATATGYDLYRILVGNDGTDVFINGNNEGRFNKGEFIEKPINSSATIEATGPILVAQFKKTSKNSSEGGSPLSDPFMMIVPPKEQFMPNYSVINTQAYEERIENEWPVTTRAYKVYDQHYISIVAPLAAIDKTYIDGNLINSNNFKPIQASNDYYYANIQVNEGAHRVNSSDRIGVYVYGYGEANSYGYVGGISMRQFDFKKPYIQSIDSCYNITGMIYDNRPGDSKIATVDCPEPTKINTKVNIGSFVPYADSVAFKASLIDNYLDGRFEVIAKDSIGLDTMAIIKIPGFTVSIDSMNNSRQLYIYNDRYRTNTAYYKVFNLRNYGEFHHTISKAYFKKNSAISIIPPAPFDINPGELFAIELSFNFPNDITITDTLYISDGCSDRAILLIKIEFKGDNTKPKISINEDDCLQKFDISATDSLWFDSGIEKFPIFTSNCEFRIVKQTLKSVVFHIEILDPYKDAIYSFIIIDYAGNETTYSDTIQGFTLTLPQFENTESKIDFGLEKIGSLYCDTLQLFNTGTMPFVIDNILLKKNLYFSIPQYQFPLIISPDEYLSVKVCFNPVNIYKQFDDTLLLIHNCLSKEVALTGKGDSVIYYGDSDCDVVIKATAHTIDRKYELEQSTPNPVLAIAKFAFTLPEKGNIKLSLFDILGNERAGTIQNELPEGRHEIFLDLETLPQGIYLYTLTTNAGILKGTLVKQ